MQVEYRENNFLCSTRGRWLLGSFCESEYVSDVKLHTENGKKNPSPGEGFWKINLDKNYPLDIRVVGVFVVELIRIYVL